jgi:hypothetical protein
MTLPTDTERKALAEWVKQERTRLDRAEPACESCGESGIPLAWEPDAYEEEMHPETARMGWRCEECQYHSAQDI